MSTQQRFRVLWVVLDGMGAEHFRYALDHGRHPAISRMSREGSISPMRPASPVCQTPPALLALFTGTQPSQNGVWGYYMPHPSRTEESLSGFHADISGTRTIWQELEERGEGYALMNVAFRADPVWRGPAPHLVLGLDGYRLWRKPSLYRLTGGGEKIDFHGLRLRSRREGGGAVSVWKGASFRARLAAGEGRLVRMTSGTQVFAHLLDPGLLLLNPLNDVVCRGTNAGNAAGNGFLEMSAFHLARRINSSRDPSLRISVEAELLASRVSFQRKADLMVEQAGNRDARLVVGYFPVVDDFNHAYFDLLLAGDERADALFNGCAAMVDDLLGRLMREMEKDTLLVVSSDHGAMAYRGSLSLNEVFAEAGLVRRSALGYDFRGSSAWYHPSDCGQVVTGSGSEKGPLRKRVNAVVERLNADLGADIGVLEGDAGSPFLAFLYPRGDHYFTGRPPRRRGSILDAKRAGGHHLSPLSPTPWIQAALGLWSAGRTPGDLPALPRENVEMKKFLMESMGLA